MVIVRRKMSSILTVYKVSESRRSEFEHAYLNEKKVAYKRGLFGMKEIITGEAYLYEYLDGAAEQKTDFEMSGFLFIDYFFTFVVLPDDLQAALTASARGEHYHVIEAPLAEKLRTFLETRSPSAAALTTFAEGEGKNEPGYVEALLHTHAQIVEWLRSCTSGTFLVLHLTF